MSAPTRAADAVGEVGGRPASARTDAAPRRRPRRRTTIAWSVAVATLLLGIVLAGAPGEDGPPLDPRSVAPDGLRGLVELLDGIGGDVDISLDPPRDTATRVFIPVDLLNRDRSEALLAWVRSGGTLVVAGPSDHLHDLVPVGGGLAGAVGALPAAPACDHPAVAEVGEIVHAGWSGFEVPTDAVACFRLDDAAAWLVELQVGDGTIIALGSADPFTNQRLDRADNAVLAAALLAPGRDSDLVVVPRPPVGEGDATLLELVPGRVWRGLAVLLVAAGLAVLWRGRRLGRPVDERLPPVLPSAELAHSVADLFQRAGSRQGAAARLRADTRAEVARLLGAPPETPPAILAATVAARAPVDERTAVTAMVDGHVGDDDGLVAVARSAAAVRAALRRAPTGSQPPAGAAVER